MSEAEGARPATAGPDRPARVLGGAGALLSEAQVAEFITAEVSQLDLDGRSVCLVVPDATRTCPLPQLLRAVHAAFAGRPRQVQVLIALGTHQPMDEEQMATWLGYRPGGLADTYPGWQVLNHQWWEPQTFTSLGWISADRMRDLSEGRIADLDVEVLVNRMVAEADIAMVIGPVFPHEVVGFSGGNKYFFPGVSGQQMINVSHWLGALITSAEMIGSIGITPVRAMIDEAAALIPAERLALCMVVSSGTHDLHAVAFGSPEGAWGVCADISAQTHIVVLDAPVQRVLSIMPGKYQDIWTAAKGMYKVEPVVADGGEVIIYAPHITELAGTHPMIEQIGYHNRDYFLGQWQRFKDLDWGDLAHSTHVRGQGTWDPESGEANRITVTFAVSIPEELVRSCNVGYRDPASVDVDAFERDPGTLVVRNAGEVLYRLRGRT